MFIQFKFCRFQISLCPFTPIQFHLLQMQPCLFQCQLVKINFIFFILSFIFSNWQKNDLVPHTSEGITVSLIFSAYTISLVSSDDLCRGFRRLPGSLRHNAGAGRHSALLHGTLYRPIQSQGGNHLLGQPGAPIQRLVLSMKASHHFRKSRFLAKQ